MTEYQLTPVEACCPVCTNECNLVLYTVDAGQAAQHYVLREAQQERHDTLRAHIEALWQQPTCDIVRCTHCGFCFANPYIAGDERFYTLAYERSGYPAWKWEFERTRDALRDLQTAGRLQDFHLLEVGAGDGAFLHRVAPDLTPKDHVLATEFSDYGRKAIEDYGITCLSEDVRALPAEEYGSRFDVVCLFQVLEHLDSLDALFAHIDSLTGDEAHLFIAVPNAERIAFNEVHGSLLDLPPNHVGRWNRSSFDVLAERHGWRIADYEIEPDEPKGKAKQDLEYRYIRKRQDPTSVANRIEQVSHRPLRRALQAVAVGGYGIARLPVLYTLLASTGLGDSQWVHLEKRPAG